ncbi:hypothetical protein MY9_3936 [Bacillus sp. JS]|nr:hypothetical protein MY9_3936 [Bacillus sp. JS]
MHQGASFGYPQIHYIGIRQLFNKWKHIKKLPLIGQFYINESKNGAAQSVIIAARIIDTLEIVPDTELSSNAFDVPALCALVPSSTPRAISLSMRK